MKRFTFRYRGLLRLRKVEEERALNGLLEAQRALLEVESGLATLAAERELLHRRLRELERDTLPMAEVLAHRRHLNRVRNLSLAAVAECRRRRQAVRAAQRELESAHRRLEVVERMRERGRREHLEGWRREETQELDELAQLARSARGDEEAEVAP